MNLSSAPLVSIILVNYNGGTVILDCLRSLQTHLQMVSYEIVVVDNASQDSSPDAISIYFPQVCVLRQAENVGFGAGNNIGAKQAQGEFLWLLNSDTCLTHDILSAQIAQLQSDPKIGIVGPMLLNPDGSFQLSVSKAIGIVGELQTLQQVRQYRHPQSRTKLAKFYSTLQSVAIVRGAAMVMRRSLFEQLGGFDENFFMYFEESDLCQRVRTLGFKVVYMPAVSLMHLGGYSVSKEPDRMALEYRRSQLYYYRKHRPIWEQIILRFYLFLKFSALFFKSFNQAYLPFVALAANLQTYQIAIPNPGLDAKPMAAK